MITFLNIFPDIEYDFQRNLLDWYEIPLVLILFFIINKWVDKKNRKNYQPYFKLFINLKLLGAIIITLLFNLYYQGGDSSAFFNDGRLLNKIILQYPSQGLRMLWVSGDLKTWPDDLANFTDGFRFYYPENTWLVCKISCLVQFITFRSMLCTSMIFGFCSAIIIWRFFKLMSEIYSYAKNGLKWAILFVPNLLLWGSGILKDTITFSCLLAIFCCLYYIFEKREKRLWNLLIFIIAGYLLFVIKSYILVSFLASCFLWIPFVFKKRIKNKLVKAIATPFIIMIMIGSLLISYSAFSSFLQSFALESVLQTASKTGGYLKYVSEQQEGSSYDIGNLDPTIEGFVSKIPAAVNVTLYRPYIWESKKPIILFAALESFAILLFSVFVFLKVNPFRFLSYIISDPILLTFIVFTIIFAAFVGVSSFNFGTLTRYRIPCIPFYLCTISIIYYRRKNAIKSI